MPYLPREQCKHGYLYRLASRNLPIGVWNAATRGFVGVRLKFGRRYLFEEYHWDEPEFATARPLEVLEPLPADIDVNEDAGNAQLFDWLKAAEFRWCSADPTTAKRWDESLDWRGH